MKNVTKKKEASNSETSHLNKGSWFDDEDKLQFLLKRELE